MTRANSKTTSVTYTLVALCTACTILIFLSNSKASAFTQNSSKKSDYIISFQSHSIKKEFEKKFRSRGQSINKNYQLITAIATTLPDNEVAQLRTNSNIVFISKDERIQLDTISTQIDQPALSTTGQTVDWGIEKIGVQGLWEQGIDGSGINVGVMDTGIANHPDLVIKGGASFVETEPDWTDGHGHGTHVAGIIAAKNNTLGTVGAAPAANLYAIKIFDSKGVTKRSNIIKGIEWAIKNKMDVVNMSFGRLAQNGNRFIADDPEQEQMIREAYNAGVTIVAASGNWNICPSTTPKSIPAMYDTVISVGATNSKNERACWSNANPELDVVAPGVSILSTYKNNEYAEMSGTSMAAPYVSGLVALRKHMDRQAGTAQYVRQHDIQHWLQLHALDLGPTGKDNEYGHGLARAPTVLLSRVAEVSVTNIAPTSVNLSWSNISGVDGFVIEEHVPGNPKPVKVLTTNNNTTSVKFSTRPSTQYTLAIYPVQYADYSKQYVLREGPKTPISFSTPMNVPSASTVSVSPSHTSISLTIQNKAGRSAGPVEQIEIYVGNASQPHTHWIAQDGEIYTSTIDNLIGATTYNLRVIAKNSSGQSTTHVTATTSLATPNATLSTNNSGDATLQWNGVSGATEYEVSGSQGTQLVPGTLYTISNFSNNKAYNFSVRAKKDRMYSKPSLVSILPKDVHVDLAEPNTINEEIAELHLMPSTTGTYTFTLLNSTPWSLPLGYAFDQPIVALKNNQLQLTFQQGQLWRTIKLRREDGKKLTFKITKANVTRDHFISPKIAPKPVSGIF